MTDLLKLKEKIIKLISSREDYKKSLADSLRKDELNRELYLELHFFSLGYSAALDMVMEEINDQEKS